MRAYKANMIPGGTTPVINVSQYDNDYAVTVTLIEGAEIYTPPVGATIRVEGTKPDGNGFEYPCTYQGNVVTMPIYTQMTAVAGRFPIELVVYQSGLRVGSCNIIFAVERAPLGEGTDISETVIPDIIAGAQAQADAAAASAASAAEAAAQVLASQIVTDASGSIATFSDGADDVAVKSLVASITPVQNLNGQANPYPPGGGKNLLKMPTYAEISAASTVVSYKSIALQLSPNTTYYLSTKFLNGYTANGKGMYVLLTNSATTNEPWVAVAHSENENGKVDGAITTGADGLLYLRFNGATEDKLTQLYANSEIQLEIGSTATTYAPYENICPISGRTGLTVTRAGKNLCPTQTIVKTGNSYYISGINDYLPFHAGTYTLSNAGTSAYAYWQKEGTEEFNVIHTGSTNVGTFTLEENCNIRLWFYTGTADATFTNIQIEFGTSATAYEPYNATEIPITWESIAGTVYGGTLDVVSGVLTVTHNAVQIKDKTWAYDATNTRFGALFTAEGIAIEATRRQLILCDAFASFTDGGGISSVPNNVIYNGGTDGRLYVKTDTATTAADFISAYGDYRIVFPLATPQTYQLTPTEVRTLLGGNTIFTDAGAVSVEYVADTKLYIDNKIAELQALVLEN